jgi:hypothetical protein
MKPSTDTLEPRRENDRNDIEEPKQKKSSTESDEAMRDIPTIDRFDDIRTKDLNDKEEPPVA